MLSAAHYLLLLVPLVATTFAVPILTPSPLRSTGLAKRDAVYTALPAGSGAYLYDYCGEVAHAEYVSNPAEQALATDCAALTQRWAGPGYWTVRDAGGWVRLAQEGTCAFEVKLQPGQVGSSDQFTFGTNDVGFYIRGYANVHNADPQGRVSVWSTVVCRREGLPLIGVDWRVIKA